MNQLPALILAVIALFVSVLSVFAPPFIDKFRDVVPDLKRSVMPGGSKTIYVSKLNKSRNIVVDITNVPNLELPTLDTAQLHMQRQRMKRAVEESFDRSSLLFITDQNFNNIDTVRIDCFNNTTYELTVPPRGTLILQCVRGCNNGFCSYEFLNF